MHRVFVSGHSFPIVSPATFTEVGTAAVDAMHKHGAVCLRGVFNDFVGAIREGIALNLTSLRGPNFESLPADTGDAEAPQFINDYVNWRRVPPFQRFVEESACGEMAAKLLKSSTASFYHEHVLVKEPGASAPTPFHIDQSYYPVAGPMLSVWVPVDDVPLQSTLLCVEGSHRWGLMRPRKFATHLDYEGSESLESMPEIEPSAHRLLGWELKPGDAIAFFGSTAHGAAGHEGTSHRRVLTARWFGDDSLYEPRPWEVSPPVLPKLRQAGEPLGGDPNFPTLFPL